MGWIKTLISWRVWDRQQERTHLPDHACAPHLKELLTLLGKMTGCRTKHVGKRMASQSSGSRLFPCQGHPMQVPLAAD